MKKILLLIPAFLLILVGCSSMTDMEASYATFTTNKENGYIVSQESNDISLNLDINSPKDFTAVMTQYGNTLELVCKGEANSSYILDGGEETTSKEAFEFCQDAYDGTLENIVANIENEMFYNSEYDTQYEKTDTGYKASGTYVDGSDYELVITTDGSVVEFTDEYGSIKMELK